MENKYLSDFDLIVFPFLIVYLINKKIDNLIKFLDFFTFFISSDNL